MTLQHPHASFTKCWGSQSTKTLHNLPSWYPCPPQDPRVWPRQERHISTFSAAHLAGTAMLLSPRSPQVSQGTSLSDVYRYLPDQDGKWHHNPLARSWPCAHHGTEVKCSNSPWGLKRGVYKRKIWLLAELWGNTWTHTTTLKVTCYTAQRRQSPFRDWECKRLQNQERRSQEANPRQWHLQGISISLCLGLLNGTLYRWIYIYRI